MTSDIIIIVYWDTKTPRRTFWNCCDWPVLANLGQHLFYVKMAKLSKFGNFSTMKSLQKLTTKVFRYVIYDDKWMKKGHFNS